MFDDKYFYCEIDNINLIKILCDVLSKISEETRLIFTKSNNRVCLNISSTNLTRSFFIKGKFNSNFIKKYYSNKNEFELIFNPLELVDILKSTDKSDNLLLLYIDKNELNNLIIEFIDKQKIDILSSNNDSDSDSDSKVESKEKLIKKKSIKKKVIKKKVELRNEKKFKLSIYYPQNQDKQVAKMNFDKIITMGVEKFHKTCKDLGTLFNYVKIGSKNNKILSFSCNDNNCDGINYFNFDDNEIILEDLNLKNKNPSGIYSLEDINILSKLSDLTTKFNFGLKNNKDNFILESSYTFDKYGTINVLYVSNRDDSEIKNISYENNNMDSKILDNVSDINNFDDKIIYIEILNINIFKIICECVEKIVSETIFKFECINDDLNIVIKCSNNSKNIFLETKIINIFEGFKKIDKSIELGIDLDKLNDILKTFDKTDKLILSVDKNDKHNLIIQIKNNKINNLKRIYKIKLLNIEKNNFLIKKEFIKKVKISSDEFYSISNEVNTIGEIIKIKCDKKQIIFSCTEDCKYVNIFKNNDSIEIINNKNTSNDENDVVFGAYEINDLHIFSKLSNFMDNFEFDLISDGMLIINSDFIESFGSISIQYLSKNQIEITPNEFNMVKSNIEIMEDKLLFFKLKKINFMKNIIDTMDKMISEVDWIFNSKNTDSNEEDKFVGLEIICTDPSKNLYLKAKLTDKLFKSYYCDNSVFRFGMSLDYFNKILKLVEKTDIAIYCYIEKSDPDNMIIKFKNLEKKNKKIFKIPLQILTSIPNPPIILTFEKKINIKLSNFLNKCKMIGNRTQFIQIECNNENLLLKCVGDKEGSITIDNNDDDNLEIISLDNKLVIGTYEIKNILLFTKFSSITENFSLFMKNNFALTNNFSFGKYGSITTILSHINEEHINNLMYDYSDDEEEVELIKNSSNIMDYY